MWLVQREVSALSYGRAHPRHGRNQESGRDGHHPGNLTLRTLSGPSCSGHRDEVPGPETHFCGISTGAEEPTCSRGRRPRAGSLYSVVRPCLAQPLPLLHSELKQLSDLSEMLPHLSGGGTDSPFHPGLWGGQNAVPPGSSQLPVLLAVLHGAWTYPQHMLLTSVWAPNPAPRPFRPALAPLCPRLALQRASAGCKSLHWVPETQGQALAP